MINYVKNCSVLNILYPSVLSQKSELRILHYAYPLGFNGCLKLYIELNFVFTLVNILFHCTTLGYQWVSQPRLLAPTQSSRALLSKVRSHNQIASAMAMYERMRKSRVERIVAYTFEHRDEFHLEDGPTQRERDAALARSFKSWSEHNHW